MTTVTQELTQECGQESDASLCPAMDVADTTALYVSWVPGKGRGFSRKESHGKLVTFRWEPRWLKHVNRINPVRAPK